MSYPENNLALQQYIDGHSSCKTNETHAILLKGTRVVLDVYKIPLKYLIFNIKNGRFKAEYLELKRKNGGRDLDPTNEDDSNKIKNLLLDLDPGETKRTKENIRIVKQKVAGIMTHDGAMIDGNRRLSILKELSLEDPTLFSEMLVARLPDSVDQDDLWKLEAGIQLGKDEIVRYKPVNELLKLKEGIDSGFSPLEIAKNLYGIDTAKEIVEKLDRLKLIDRYLEYVGTPLKYNEIDGKMEQFKEAMKMQSEISKLSDTFAKREITTAVFELIKHGETMDDLRLMKKMLKKPSEQTRSKLIQIGQHGLKSSGSKSPNPKIDVIETLWTDATEQLRAESNDNPRLLTNAQINLEKIELTNDNLKEPQSQELIKKLIRHLESLKKLVN